MSKKFAVGDYVVCIRKSRVIGLNGILLLPYRVYHVDGFSPDELRLSHKGQRQGSWAKKLFRRATDKDMEADPLKKEMPVGPKEDQPAPLKDAFQKGDYVICKYPQRVSNFQGRYLVATRIYHVDGVVGDHLELSLSCIYQGKWDQKLFRHVTDKDMEADMLTPYKSKPVEATVPSTATHGFFISEEEWKLWNEADNLLRQMSECLEDAKQMVAGKMLGKCIERACGPLMRSRMNKVTQVQTGDVVTYQLRVNKG